MWLGRDAVRLDRLLGFICENTSPSDSLRITSSIGPILTAETGDISFKRPSFWRRRESALMLFRSEKKRSKPFEPRQLIEAIKDFSKSSSEGTVVVKIQMNGKLHQLQGDIKMEPVEGEDGTFFLSASTVITQVFEEPGIFEMGSRPSLDFAVRPQEPAAEEDADDFEDRILEIDEIEEADAALDAWASSWAEEWDEAPEDEDAGDEADEPEEGEPDAEDEGEEGDEPDAEDDGDPEGGEDSEGEGETEGEPDEDSHDDGDSDDEPEEDAEQEGEDDGPAPDDDADDSELEDEAEDTPEDAEPEEDPEQDNDADDAEPEEDSEPDDDTDGDADSEGDDTAGEDDDASDEEDEDDEAADSHEKHTAK